LNEIKSFALGMGKNCNSRCENCSGDHLAERRGSVAPYFPFQEMAHLTGLIETYVPALGMSEFEQTPDPGAMNW
jgi:hypothetical protein